MVHSNWRQPLLLMTRNRWMTTRGLENGEQHNFIKNLSWNFFLNIAHKLSPCRGRNNKFPSDEFRKFLLWKYYLWRFSFCAVAMIMTDRYAPDSLHICGCLWRTYFGVSCINSDSCSPSPEPIRVRSRSRLPTLRSVWRPPLIDVLGICSRTQLCNRCPRRWEWENIIKC